MGMGEAPEEVRSTGGEDGKVEANLRALFLAVAVVAFAASPLIRFADVSQTLTVAFIGGVAVQLMMVAGRSAAGAAASLVLIACLMWGTDILWEALQDRNANQQRCLQIEADMASVDPVRENGPDLFQALGCDPQPRAAEAIIKSWTKK